MLLTAPFVATASADPPPPWQRTEVRDDCVDFELLRRPLFGETHVHTGYSFDAISGDVTSLPSDAYAFAKGAPIGLPPLDGLGQPTRTVQLRRPLDFAAVTDHSEYFGEVQMCLTPGLPGYDDSICQNFRGSIPQVGSAISIGVISFGVKFTAEDSQRFTFCGPGGIDCLTNSSPVWLDTQDAAEAHYDRSDQCTFTSFVAYEWTGVTGFGNLHRNVIFRNGEVPALPTSYFEEWEVSELHNALETQCKDGLPNCDVLAIPHNSNLSGGRMFQAAMFDGTPFTPADAAQRARMEPVVEITQHKGDSECRPGVMTNDEQCAYEKWESSILGQVNTSFPPLLFTRNGLKEGLRQESALGVNPFQFGVVGATDSHNATPGLTNEEDYVDAGHLGTRDGGPPEFMLTPLGLGAIGGIYSNPGGLGVIWAEENSRDAVFEALRRREVYATSGTRPIVRFFGGRLRGVSCDDPDFVEAGYRAGVPMGGEIGTVASGSGPRFAVLAQRDPGTPGSPGAPLQRIQIVKGWRTRGGALKEKVFDVAGDPDNGATVDPATCAPTGAGFDSLCTVWSDPEFNREERAFYYARVLENPVCRWSTYICNAAGVDCDGAVVPAGYEQCCNPDIEPIIQERAWTSPIFYRPESPGRVRAEIRRGTAPGTDRLKLTARIDEVAPDLDFDANDVTLRISDDDEIFAVTIPAGTLVAKGKKIRALVDPTGSLGGIRRLTFRRGTRDRAVLKLETVGMDLSAADAGDHMVKIELSAGVFRAEHSRLWKETGGKLAIARR